MRRAGSLPGGRRAAADARPTATGQTAAGQFPPAARRAADRRPRRHDLHGAAGAAPPEHLRRLEPAGHLADHSRASRWSVSAFASWWLAQHLSAPIRRIQEGARALAGENLDVRVSAGLEGRKDELAVLASDFDAMADQLRANRSAITQLLRDISHELRSPLARMRVALGLARQPTGRSRSASSIDWSAEIERLDGLISQVLKLARLHGTDAPFERESVRPRRGDRGSRARCELRRRRQELQGAAQRGGATARCAAIASCCAAPIENVLRNAVRYSPHGAPVEVTVERSDGGTRRS